jgi:hypothetical protein
MRKLMIALAVAATTAPLLEAPASAHPQRYHRDSGRIYYGNGTYRCRGGRGTTGLILGGAVGALAGRAIDGGRDRTLGTVAGAAGGALLGRELQRSRRRC